MDSVITGMLAELAEQQTATSPILEGFGDSARVGLLPSALDVAQEGSRVYAHRLSLLRAALAALTALQEHAHYPRLPRFRVGESDLQDFADQIATMTAAHAQLDVEEPAVSGVITFRDE